MRHQHCWAGLLLSLTSFPCGCAVAPAADGPPLHDDALTRGLHAGDLLTGEWWKLLVRPRSPAPDLVAFTKKGDLALVDGETGAVREEATTLLKPPGGRDVVYDPWKGRAIVFEMDGGSVGGGIAAYPIMMGAEGNALGARSLLAVSGGEGRVLASPAGPVVFGDEGGDHWSVILDGGGMFGPVSAPRPMSAWLDGGAVQALAYGPSSAEIDAVSMPVGGGPVSMEAFGIDAASVPPCTRVVAAPARGGALLFDVEGSFLGVRGVYGASVGTRAIVSLGESGQRIEAAVPLAGGEVVVLLLSGTTQVVALAIDAQLEVAGVARLPLPGLVSPSTRWLSHDLVAQGPSRVAAATSAGVFSIRVTQTGAGVHLALAPGFDGSGLRGPIGAVTGPPS